MNDYELTRAIQVTGAAAIGIIREVRARENNSPFTAEEAIEEIKRRLIDR